MIFYNSYRWIIESETCNIIDFNLWVPMIGLQNNIFLFDNRIVNIVFAEHFSVSFFFFPFCYQRKLSKKNKNINPVQLVRIYIYIFIIFYFVSSSLTAYTKLHFLAHRRRKIDVQLKTKYILIDSSPRAQQPLFFPLYNHLSKQALTWLGSNSSSPRRCIRENVINYSEFLTFTMLLYFPRVRYNNAIKTTRYFCYYML